MSMQAMARWLGGAKHVAPLLALLAATLAAVAALGVVASAASAATFGNPSGITMIDGSDSCNSGEAATNPGTANSYPSTITIPVETFPAGSRITDVNVTISGLFHGYPDDIGLLLVSPEGQSVILMADSGGGFSVLDINLTFDDEASDPVPDNTQLVTGSSYQPKQGTSLTGTDCTASFPLGAPAGPYGTTLSAFDGTDPEGEWKLYVIDDTLQLAGLITGGWSLDITTAEDTTPPTVTKSTPENKADSITATFSEEVQNVSTETFFLERQIAVKKSPPKYVLVDATVDPSADPNDVNVYVLDPVQDLPKGTYRATITTDVTDMADNALEDPVVWTFTVAK
jgi:subtilisin-like proprotein convertase family protein